MNIFWVLLSPIMAFLDRWGGGGFHFLRAPFNDGQKAARKFGIPAILWLTNPGFESGLAAGMLALLFSFNLDEIEARNAEEIALWSFVMFFGIAPFAGAWAALPAVWWPIGIYLSNFGWGVRQFKNDNDPFWQRSNRLDWFWVELIRGALIGAAVAAFRV